ncbi:MAG: AAA family ATPase [Planctomycetes bacterium]|nr:AAA family ATPase [Planctomycetota bacterium]
MNIVDIGIANFRSFDESGIMIKNLGKINIFIGKNNSGKSNILRFFRLLSKHFSELNKFPSSDIENQFMRNNRRPELTVSIKSDHYHSILVQKSNPRHGAALRAIDPFIGKESLSIRFDLLKRKLAGPNPFEDVTAASLNLMPNKFLRLGREDLMNEVTNDLLRYVFEQLSAFQKLIWARPFFDTAFQAAAAANRLAYSHCM